MANLIAMEAMYIVSSTRLSDGDITCLVHVDPVVMRSPPNVVIGNGVGSVKGVSTTEWYLKLAYYNLMT